MGAWGIGAFENDTACDWSDDLLETSDLTLLKTALKQVIDEEEYLDSDLACEAIAACEVIALLLGHESVSDAYTESIETWVAANKSLNPKPLLPLAHQALDRILAPDSELLELWQETEEADTWKASLETLRAKLK